MAEMNPNKIDPTLRPYHATTGISRETEPSIFMLHFHQDTSDLLGRRAGPKWSAMHKETNKTDRLEEDGGDDNHRWCNWEKWLLLMMANYARQGGRVSFFCAAAFSFRRGKGRRLVRLLPEWPSAVPGRIDLLVLSVGSWVCETLRLNEEPVPLKLWRLRGVLESPDGRRRRLYGGGSSKDDRTGVGDETSRFGLREDDASRLDRRLIDRPGPAPGAGDADMSLRNGLRNGMVDDGRGVRDDAEAWREVVPGAKGLKL